MRHFLSKLFWCLFISHLCHAHSDEWMFKRIEKDFACFISHKITPNHLIDYLKKNNSQPLILFNIKSSNVFIQDKTTAANRLSFRMKALVKFFKKTVTHYAIPNLYFLADIGDGYRDANIHTPVPVIVFSKNVLCNNGLILIPDSGCISKMNKLSQVVYSSNKQLPFTKRIPKLIWRGAATGAGAQKLELYVQSPRFKLAELSALHPNSIDAKFSIIGVSASPEVKKLLMHLGYTANFMPIAEHQKYKYQILVDGNTTSWTRAYWQLISDSLMFKQESENIEWYYDALIPYIHYVPVKSDMSDLIEKITWAQRHNSETIKIIKQANKFAQENLNPIAMARYIAYVLKAYAKLQSS